MYIIKTVNYYWYSLSRICIVFQSMWKCFVFTWTFELQVFLFLFSICKCIIMGLDESSWKLINHRVKFNKWQSRFNDSFWILKFHRRYCVIFTIFSSYLQFWQKKERNNSLSFSSFEQISFSVLHRWENPVFQLS